MHNTTQHRTAQHGYGRIVTNHRILQVLRCLVFCSSPSSSVVAGRLLFAINFFLLLLSSSSREASYLAYAPTHTHTHTHMPQESQSGDSTADLPLDESGRLYHLGLMRGEGNRQGGAAITNALVSNLIITVGDEKRAKAIALMLDGASLDAVPSASPSLSVSPSSSSASPPWVSEGSGEGRLASTTSLASVLSEGSSAVKGVFCCRSSRGFLTYTGRYKGRPVSVVAIGMGYPNMDFFVREARAIVSGPLAIVRVGTCGAISRGTIGMVAIPTDGAVMVQRNYDYPFAFSNGSLESLKASDGHHHHPYRISRPYPPDGELTRLILGKASQYLVEDLIVRGLHASSDSFYASQGRPSQEFLDMNSTLIDSLIQRGISTVEMETAQLFHLASCVARPEEGIKAAAIHMIVADRPNNQFLSNLDDRLRLDRIAAQIALEALVCTEISDIEDQLTVI